MSFEAIISDSEFISIRYTFFWIISLAYSAVGNGPTGGEYRRYKWQQEWEIFNKRLHLEEEIFQINHNIFKKGINYITKVWQKISVLYLHMYLMSFSKSSLIFFSIPILFH